MLPLYTRWLSVSEYGISDLITVYATLAIGIVACVIYDAVFVIPKNAKFEDQRKYFSSSLYFAFVMITLAAFVFYFIKELALVFDWQGAFFEYIWLVFFLVATEILFKISQQFCRSIDKIVSFSISGLIVTLFTALLSFILIPRYNIYGYVMAMGIAYIFGSLFAFVSSKSIKYLSYNSFSYPHLKEMLLYSLPLIPNVIIWWIVDAMNRPFLEHSVGTEGVAFYAVANKFPGILTMAYLVFLTSWQISVLDEYGKPGFEKFYNNILKFVSILSSAALLVITFSSKLIIHIFAASEYSTAWSLIPVLTLGAMFSNISGFIGCVFSAARTSKYYFYSSIWAAISSLALNALLIPLLGITGAAISTCLSLFIMSIARVKYSSRFVRIGNLHVFLFLVGLDLLFYFLLITGVNALSLVLFFILILLIHLLCIMNAGKINISTIWRNK